MGKAKGGGFNVRWQRGTYMDIREKKISWGMCLSAWSSYSNNKTSHAFCTFPCQ